MSIVLTRIAVVTGVLCIATLSPGLGRALVLVAPPDDIGVVGRLRTIVAEPGANLPDVAVRYRVGQEALRRANPTLPRALPIGHRSVRLPTRFVLPRASREGIVINLPELRLYRYLPGSAAGAPRILTYAVSIGQVDWQSPLGESRIIGRQAAPAWRPPASIRAEALARGISLPAIVAPGPDNPLGHYALYLDRPGYLIHGTNAPGAIGLRVTHGCVRLYPQDIAALYRHVASGTRVQLVNEPVKVGWHAGRLYLEVHPPLAELDDGREALLDTALRLVGRALGNRVFHPVMSSRIRQAVEQRDGLPIVISTQAAELGKL